MNLKTTRLVTATLMGVVTGLICMQISRFTAGVDYWPVGIYSLLHHTVLGLVIGVSSLKFRWPVHGLFWGATFGLFYAVGFVGSPIEPWISFLFVVMWGFLIELLTTKVFKRPQ